MMNIQKANIPTNVGVTNTAEAKIVRAVIIVDSKNMKTDA